MEMNLCRILFFIFLVSIPFIRTVHGFGEKLVHMRKATLQRGFSPPKKGGGTPRLEGNSLDIGFVTLEEYFCQI